MGFPYSIGERQRSLRDLETKCVVTQVVWRTSTTLSHHCYSFLLTSVSCPQLDVMYCTEDALLLDLPGIKRHLLAKGIDKDNIDTLLRSNDDSRYALCLDASRRMARTLNCCLSQVSAESLVQWRACRGSVSDGNRLHRGWCWPTRRSSIVLRCRPNSSIQQNLLHRHCPLSPGASFLHLFVPVCVFLSFKLYHQTSSAAGSLPLLLSFLSIMDTSRLE
jgi:hypothetical protein